MGKKGNFSTIYPCLLSHNENLLMVHQYRETRKIQHTNIISEILGWFFPPIKFRKRSLLLLFYSSDCGEKIRTKWGEEEGVSLPPNQKKRSLGRETHRVQEVFGGEGVSRSRREGERKRVEEERMVPILPACELSCGELYVVIQKPAFNSGFQQLEFQQFPPIADNGFT